MAFKCVSGKQCYSKVEAQTVKNSAAHHHGVKHYRIYHCGSCNMWHISRRKKDVR